MESTSGQFFFRASNLASSIEHQRYCYKKIARKTKPEKETDYPIYVTIGADSVFFQCSAYHDGSSQKLEHYGAGKIQEFSFTLEFQNSIRTWLCNQDEISTGFLDPNLYCRYENKEEQSFSNLMHWPLPARSDPSQVLLTHRELALDFLFDLFYSNIFNTIPSTEKLKAYLLNTTLSKTVLAKCNFLFYLELFESNLALKGNINSHRKSNINEKAWLKARLDESAKVWATCIRLPEAEEFFIRENQGIIVWFEDIEIEHNQIFKQTSHHSELPNEATKSAQWFLQRYNLPRAAYLNFWVAINTNRKVMLICTMLASFLYFGFPLQISPYPQIAVAGTIQVSYSCSLLATITLLGFFFFLSFLFEKLISGLLGILLKKTSIGLSSTIQGIRIFLPKVILVNCLAWWWLLFQRNENAGLNKVLEFFHAYESLFWLSLYLVSLTGIVAKTSMMPSMHNPMKICFRSAFLVVIGGLSSLGVGLILCLLGIGNNGSTEGILIHAPMIFASDIVCQISLETLYFYTWVAATLGLIFELSAQSVIEILSP